MAREAIFVCLFVEENNFSEGLPFSLVWHLAGALSRSFTD